MVDETVRRVMDALYDLGRETRDKEIINLLENMCTTIKTKRKLKGDSDILRGNVEAILAVADFLGYQLKDGEEVK